MVIIRLFKRLFRFIAMLFSTPEAEVIPEIVPEIIPEAPKPKLYFDTYIIFKNAPLIGKLYQHGKKIWRIVDYKIYKGRFKCQIELL